MDTTTEWRDQSQDARQRRRDAAVRDFPPVRQHAREAGFQLIRQTDAHYQLWAPGRKWLVNLYPGNCRLYHDKKKRGPYLRVSEEWSLMEVVEAAIQEAVKAEFCETDEFEKSHLRRL